MRKLLITILICALTLPALIVWSQNREVKKQPETMPLVHMMRLLLADMQQLNEGIYTGNFRLIMEAAGLLANHPVMTEDDRRLFKNSLGEEIRTFVSLDRQVHHHSVPFVRRLLLKT